ncbi:hypothetical protein L086_0106830 [Staphylococcus epidermidis UC7032]|nr:hypothetical protein L086_0106830 [Staphylococcus epidermidis UC7032]
MKKRTYINRILVRIDFVRYVRGRKARIDALGLSLKMQYIKQEEDKQFIFLTLTTPNVTDEHLESEIKNYIMLFKRCLNAKKVNAITKGYVKN